MDGFGGRIEEVMRNRLSDIITNVTQRILETRRESSMSTVTFSTSSHETMPLVTESTGDSDLACDHRLRAIFQDSKEEDLRSFTTLASSAEQQTPNSLPSWDLPAIKYTNIESLSV